VEGIALDPVDDQSFIPHAGTIVEAELGRRFTACVLRVERAGTAPWERAWGQVGDEGAARTTPGTLFDLASLTKLYVATACLSLAGRGVLSLDGPVREVIPAFAGEGRDSVTFRHLLTHTSGLPDHLHLYRHCHGPDEMLEAICTTALAYRPGERVVYSCLGFILLGAALSRLAGMPLDRLVQELVLRPLGIAEEVTYVPDARRVENIAPTEVCSWRGRRLRGEVHDENAAAMGGISGNAGLFGTARGVTALGRLYLAGSPAGSPRCGGPASQTEVLAPDLAAEAVREHACWDGERRGLGWMLKNLVAPQTSAGRLFSPRSHGHTGFTGTSLWVDPDRGLIVALLTNRVYFGRETTDLLGFRAAVHDAVAAAHS
jgi:CubicO group peptidase (beta-lactamase class C family)